MARGSVATFRDFRGRKEFGGEDGEKGRGKRQKGGDGRDVSIEVPVGTEVVIQRIGEEGEGERIDLLEEGQEMVAAWGGEGGKGNSRFTTSVNQAPRLAERGEPGQELWVHLELKLLADVGLVGYPNAGKSTFLAAVSAARPAVGAYAFTTLEPNLGVVQVGWREVVVADLPGLVEGAHEGRGLGLRFLRHAERTAVLIHLVDGAQEDPVAAWEAVNRELRLYGEALANKPQVVVINKVDLPEVQARLAAIGGAFRAVGVVPLAASGATGEGVSQVVEGAVALVDRLRGENARVQPPLPVRRLSPRARREPPRVVRVEGGFVVHHQRAARLAAGSDVTDPEARAQLQRELERMGVLRELARAGVAAGDTVRLGDVELEWR